jgi:Tol biopolymer transport system component
MTYAGRSSILAMVMVCVFFLAGAFAFGATTERVRVGDGGEEGNDDCDRFSKISSDGRYAVFSSDADDLVSGDTNNNNDVFVYDRATGSCELASEEPFTGNQLPHKSWFPSIDADGDRVAFMNEGFDIVQGYYSHCYVYKCNTTATVRVSENTANEPANGRCL